MEKQIKIENKNCRYLKTSLLIPKGYSQAINQRRTDNAMAAKENDKQ
jgi:hypothetical protein